MALSIYSPVWAYVRLGDSLVACAIRRDGAIVGYNSRQPLEIDPATVTFTTFHDAGRAMRQADTTSKSVSIALVTPKGAPTSIGRRLAVQRNAARELDAIVLPFVNDRWTLDDAIALVDAVEAFYAPEIVG